MRGTGASLGYSAQERRQQRGEEVPPGGALQQAGIMHIVGSDWDRKQGRGTWNWERRLLMPALDECGLV